MVTTATLAVMASALVSLVNGHGYVTGTKNHGVWTTGQNPLWYNVQNMAPPTAGWKALNQDSGFVEPASFGRADINCHKSARTNTRSVRANAGDNLTVFWNTWQHAHKGPIINYLAPVSNFASASAGSLAWTKISQTGHFGGSNPGAWATDVMMAHNFSSTVRIPPKLKPGNYVLRHEIISLQGAANDNGAQSYPQCLNIVVGGSGSVSLPRGTRGINLYRRNEPGILFDLHRSFTSYPYPGPAVWTGAN